MCLLLLASQPKGGARQARDERRRQDPATVAKRLERQIDRCLASSTILQLPEYNVHNASVTTTGWMGGEKKVEKEQMKKLFESPKVWDILKSFERVYYQQ